MKQRKTALIFFICFSMSANAAAAPQESICGERIHPQKPQSTIIDSALYNQVVFFGPMPILGYKHADSRALCMACRLLEAMTAGNKEMILSLGTLGARAIIFPGDLKITDLPEHRYHKPDERTHTGFLLRDVAGLGPSIINADFTASDKGLATWPPLGSVFIHEFAHAVHRSLMWKLKPENNAAIAHAYQRAMKKKRWTDTYAATTEGEYFAEGVEIYFRSKNQDGGYQRKVMPQDRESLKDYDPLLFKVIDSVFRSSWRRSNIPPDYNPCNAPLP